MEDRRKHIVHVKDERRTGFFEKTFEEMLNTMNVGVLILAEDYKIVYTNDAFLKITSYTKEDLPLLKFEDILPDHSKELLMERSRKRLIGEDISLPSNYIDLELVRKNGEMFTCNMSPGTIIHNGVPCVIYAGVETTSQRKIEKALEQFFEFCPLPAFIKNRDGSIIKATNSYQKSVGKSELEIIGKKSHEIFTTSFADKIDEEDEIVFKTKKPITVEEVLDNRHYVKTKFPINGDLIGGFSVDITDRVETEKILEESYKSCNELYSVLRSLLDTMPSMLWVYDSHKNIKFSNKALQEYLIDIDVFEDDDIIGNCSEEKTFIKSFNINNSPRYFDIRKTPLLDDSGKIIGCCGSLKDVTETLKQKDTLLKKIEKMEGETKTETEKVQNILRSTLTLFNERWSK